MRSLRGVLYVDTIEEVGQGRTLLRSDMTIAIDPKLEARLRDKAAAEGLTVSAYVERLVSADQAAEEELEALALEGLDSGESIEVGSDYWEDKHRRLNERLKRTDGR